MDILLTRDSVAMGDDFNAPHFRTIELPENTTIVEIIDRIITDNYLASIHGGKATWSVVSKQPIAVIAQQWPNAKMLPQFSHSLESLLKDSNIFKIHINYHAQLEPDLVYSVLSRFHYPP